MVCDHYSSPRDRYLHEMFWALLCRTEGVPQSSTGPEARSEDGGFPGDPYLPVTSHVGMIQKIIPSDDPISKRVRARVRIFLKGMDLEARSHLWAGPNCACAKRRRVHTVRAHILLQMHECGCQGGPINLLDLGPPRKSLY